MHCSKDPHSAVHSCQYASPLLQRHEPEVGAEGGQSGVWKGRMHSFPSLWWYPGHQVLKQGFLEKFSSTAAFPMLHSNF